MGLNKLKIFIYMAMHKYYANEYDFQLSRCVNFTAREERGQAGLP
jgi:hypothetical protein